MLFKVLWFLGNVCFHPPRNQRKNKVFRFLDALAEINSAQVEENRSDAEDFVNEEDYVDEEEEEMRRLGM